ncbi:MAG TPA: hypothetical protein VF690_17630 [Hymenobacter sp.]|jgi:antitoxin component YwqK of YwqJK toxin-antitoxin module
MRLSRLVLMVCGVLELAACTSTHGLRQTNRSDQHGLAKGRWRTYYDAAERESYTTGQYRHGRPVGTFKYYAPTGVLDHTERYGREGFCEVTYWHPNGRVARQGRAQWLTGKKGARFYWFGPWTSYDEAGQLTAINTYTDGSLTRVETYDGGQLVKVETYEKGRLTGTSSSL